MIQNIAKLVLSTVNAPYAMKLDELTLVACILDPAIAKSAAGPVSSFFSDVPENLQKQFAFKHGISEATLVVAAKKFANWSGQSYAIAA